MTVYNGEWRSKSDRKLRATIEGCLLWRDEKVTAIVYDDQSRIIVNRNGEDCHGVLNEGGEINWSDGDLWSRIAEG